MESSNHHKANQMQAIEFEAIILNGQIRIPLQYPNLEQVKAKVIVLYTAAPAQGNYNKQSLLLSLEKAAQKGVFQHIPNAVKWQQQLRNEWE
ncbi:MAG: hypothetical protein RLZZ628_1360 [Bacteroidota bacterium]